MKLRREKKVFKDCDEDCFVGIMRFNVVEIGIIERLELINVWILWLYLEANFGYLSGG